MEKVYEVLMNNKHLTTEEVYELVKKEIPTVSLATIYRNLYKLRDMGKVNEINAIGLSGKVWEANRYNHFHFICKKCGNIYDIDIKKEDYERILNIEIPHEIREFCGTFYGVCQSCKG